MRYRSAGRADDARAACTKAEDAFRALANKTAFADERGRYLARAGEAQAGRGDTENAEQTLREAVRIAPGEWETWTALGQRLTALEGLFPKEAFAGIPNEEVSAALKSPETQLALIARSRPAPEIVARLRARIAEGRACLDRAVACAPQNCPEPYSNRASAGMTEPILNVMLLALEKASGKTGDAQTGSVTLTESDDIGKVATTVSGVFAPQVATDFSEAAKRSPRAPLLFGVASFIEAMRAMAENEGVLKDDAKARFAGDIDRLVAASNDETQKPTDRIMGYQMATIFSSILLKNRERGEAAAIRGLRAFPESVPLQEARLGTLVEAERWGEAREVSAALVRAAPTTGRRLTLAKIAAKLNRNEEAEEQAREAVRKDPENGRAIVALAVTLLKNSASSPQKLTEAGALLAAWDARGAQTFPADDASADRANLLAARAAFFALTGDMSSARTFAARAVEADKDGESAQAVRDQLAALETKN